MGWRNEKEILVKDLAMVRGELAMTKEALKIKIEQVDILSDALERINRGIREEIGPRSMHKIPEVDYEGPREGGRR